MAYTRIRRRRSEARDEGSRAASALALALICMCLVIGTSVARRLRDGEPLGLSSFGDWIASRLASAPGSGAGAAARAGSGVEVTNLDVDIDGDGKLEAAVAVRDARGNGRIELYRRGASGAYQLMAQVDSGPVVELEAVVLRQDGEEMWSRLMLARAEYDQTVGAMTRAQVLTAYAWDAAAGDLVPVWQMTVASESVFNGDDELARADLQPEMARKVKGWGRLASAAAHRFVGGGSGGAVGGVAGAVPHVQVASAQEVHSYIQADDTFVSLAKRTVNQAFVWSQKWKHFILTEAEVGREGATADAYPGAPEGQPLAPGTKVAVLEQERKCVEGIVFRPPYLARVLLSDGRCCFVRDDLLLMASEGQVTMLGATDVDREGAEVGWSGGPVEGLWRTDEASGTEYG